MVTVFRTVISRFERLLHRQCHSHWLWHRRRRSPSKWLITVLNTVTTVSFLSETNNHPIVWIKSCDPSRVKGLCYPNCLSESHMWWHLSQIHRNNNKKKKTGTKVLADLPETLPPATFVLARRYRRGCGFFEIVSASHPERRLSFSISSSFLIFFVLLPSFSFMKNGPYVQFSIFTDWAKSLSMNRLETVANWWSNQWPHATYHKRSLKEVLLVALKFLVPLRMASIHLYFAGKQVGDTQKRGKLEMRSSCRKSLDLHWSASAPPGRSPASVPHLRYLSVSRHFNE